MSRRARLTRMFLWISILAGGIDGVTYAHAQVLRVVRRWVIYDWLRVAAIAVAFLSSVRAISVPFPGAQGSRSSLE